MLNATTAARNGRHLLRTVDIATSLAKVRRGPTPREGERRDLRSPNGAPTEWTARSSQVEARPRRRKSAMTRKWHARFPEVSEPIRQESEHPVLGLPRRAANGRCGSDSVRRRRSTDARLSAGIVAVRLSSRPNAPPAHPVGARAGRGRSGRPPGICRRCGRPWGACRACP